MPGGTADAFVAQSGYVVSMPRREAASFDKRTFTPSNTTDSSTRIMVKITVSISRVLRFDAANIAKIAAFFVISILFCNLEGDYECFNILSNYEIFI